MTITKTILTNKDLEEGIKKLEEIKINEDLKDEEFKIRYKEMKNILEGLTVNACDLRLKPFYDLLKRSENYFYWITEGA
ncbi:MAG: hypothetical protein AABX30_00185 [Nanoarchaeota archaeon]